MNNRLLYDTMEYKSGDTFKSIPVLKFIEYDKIVVLLNDRPEVAHIDGQANNFNEGEICHISALPGTVADLEVVGVPKSTHSVMELYKSEEIPDDDIELRKKVKKAATSMKSRINKHKSEFEQEMVSFDMSFEDYTTYRASKVRFSNYPTLEYLLNVNQFNGLDEMFYVLDRFCKALGTKEMNESLMLIAKSIRVK